MVHAFPSCRRSLLLAAGLLVSMFLMAPSVQAATTPMPSFQLTPVNRSKTIDSSAYRGKVLLINFWATWCPPCREELPGFVKVQKELGPKGFTVIGISIDTSGVSVVRRFLKRMGITYPVGMSNSQVLDAFGGIQAIPISFLVNRKGEIVKSYQGYADHAMVKADVERLLQ